jgi:hypothetical protein
MDPIAFMAGGLLASTLYVFAFRRKGRVGATQIGASVIRLASPAPPSEVFDVIAAIGPPHHVDDADQDKLALVLSSRPSVWSYGFLYPVVIHPADDGGSVLEIGVKSRLIHIGPGMGFAHARCVKAIEALLTVPPARVT